MIWYSRTTPVEVAWRQQTPVRYGVVGKVSDMRYDEWADIDISSRLRWFEDVLWCYYMGVFLDMIYGFWGLEVLHHIG